ncbi:helix-turn-helix domain-containing protein [Nocardioides stalactiti]|uniref:helix-turn-helix domain-containing protein n=1 Tax=Nocardioides stalactiti TaxID=2755356 RepID=UPI0016010F10|nr:helix-turn-helix domain-containing protein [Nocardioides stalactiti]
MAGEGSPPTTRVLDVLDLIASRGGDLRAADVARELGLSRATCHAIVHALCQRGWVVRAPHGRTLRLGPGLAPVARAAAEQRGAATRALEAARGLCGTTGYTASVIELVDRTMYASIVDPADPRGPVLSQQVTYAAPYGSLFAAWSSPEERSEWFRNGLVAGPAATSYGAFLDQARSDGVLVERMSPVLEQAAPLLEASAAGTMAGDLRRMVRPVVDEVVRGRRRQRRAPADPQPVTSVAAPVVAADGQMTIALVVHPLRTIGARELHRAKTLVRAAADTVSRSVATADEAGPGSRRPTPAPARHG